MSQILPNVHQITINYGGRPLRLYLLIGSAASLLIDAGDPSIPQKDILPYFNSINFDPKNLTYCLITHPDFDHSCGIAELKKICPNVRFICGAADRAQVESPEAIVDLRGRVHCKLHHEGPEGEDRLKAIARFGSYTPVDFGFTGGEILRLGATAPPNTTDSLAVVQRTTLREPEIANPLDTLEILHLPGHSHGHLGIFIPAHNTAIIGDAVHDRFAPNFESQTALSPTYMYIDEYLGTIARLRAMNLDRIHSAHWRDCTTNAEVIAWLDLSRDYALSAQRIILNIVKSNPGITLHQILTTKAKPALGDWPPARDSLSRYFIAGHLEHLTTLGAIEMRGDPPVKFFPL